MKDLNYYTKYENSKYPFFHRKILCQTLLGNDVDYITINNSNLKRNNKSYAYKVSAGKNRFIGDKKNEERLPTIR